MKIVPVAAFTKRFSTLSHERLRVRSRKRIVGTWTPAEKTPPPLDVMKRLKQTFKRPLPFTGAALLKAGKRR
jgi:hypothetical protein